MRVRNIEVVYNSFTFSSILHTVNTSVYFSLFCYEINSITTSFKSPHFIIEPQSTKKIGKAVFAHFILNKKSMKTSI